MVGGLGDRYEDTQFERDIEYHNRKIAELLKLGDSPEVIKAIKFHENRIEQIGGNLRKSMNKGGLAKKKTTKTKMAKGGSVRKGHTDRRKGMFYK